MQSPVLKKNAEASIRPYDPTSSGRVVIVATTSTFSLFGLEVAEIRTSGVVSRKVDKNIVLNRFLES